MIKMISVLVLSGILICSCDKEGDSDEYPFEAEVLGRNMDCRIYAVRILSGLSQIQAITGSATSDSIYIAQNLPAELETDGLKIILNVRRPFDNELSACTTLGPSYRWLTVVYAKKK